MAEQPAFIFAPQLFKDKNIAIESGDQYNEIRTAYWAKQNQIALVLH
jgi:hypothetical protein